MFPNCAHSSRMNSVFCSGCVCLRSTVVRNAVTHSINNRSGQLEDVAWIESVRRRQATCCLFKRIQHDNLMAHLSPLSSGYVVIFSFRINHDDRTRIAEQCWDDHASALARASWREGHQMRVTFVCGRRSILAKRSPATARKVGVLKPHCASGFGQFPPE